MLFPRCRECVETEGNCGWCLYDFSCTERRLSCSTAVSFVRDKFGQLVWQLFTIYMLIMFSDFSLQLHTNQSYTDVCPVLTPPPISDSGGYVQPVVVDTNLMVYGINLPPTSFSLSDVANGSADSVEQNETIQYKCRFGTTVVPAQRHNSSVVICMMKVGQVRRCYMYRQQNPSKRTYQLLFLTLFHLSYSLALFASCFVFTSSLCQLTLSPSSGKQTRSLELLLVNPSIEVNYTLDTSTGKAINSKETKSSHCIAFSSYLM